MWFLALVVVFAVPALAAPPLDCRGTRRDIDIRCACEKDPASQQCKMVKAGFYDPDRNKALGASVLGWNGTVKSGPGVSTPSSRAAQPAQPKRARVVPLAHTDYLRFLHPDAQLVAGGNLGKLFQTTELAGGLFGQQEPGGASDRLLAALKEVDRLWISMAPGNDAILLMTGRFETGAMANMFYAKGIVPVFLGGAQAMMIGSEPSIQAALRRLSAAPAAGGWVVTRARDLSRNHETWIVHERSGAGSNGGALAAVRQFALGFRLTGEVGVDGEAIADSASAAADIASWLNETKDSLRQKTGAGALDSLKLERAGAALRFSSTDKSLLDGDAGKAALSSDFGVELYPLMFGGFPGAQIRTVAEDRLLSVKPGSKKEDLLVLLGPPLSVSAIQGLEPPRETWTYQVPFGRKYALKLESGVVTGPLAQAR